MAVLFVLASLVPVPVTAQTDSARDSGLDFSGVDRFWATCDEMASGRDPSPAAWDELFATPGLAALERREHRREALTRAYRLVCNSVGADSVATAAAAGGFLGFALPHLVRVPRLRAELTALEADLRAAAFVATARERAARLLPPGLAERYPPPPVAFVFFAPDGRGYPGIIVADLLNIMESRDRVGFFAHELHHFYRNRVAVLDGEFGEEDFYLGYVLVNLEEEGTADQLDKADLPGLTDAALRRQVPNPDRRDFFERYRRHYAEANDWLARIDTVLQEIDRHPARRGAQGEALHESLPIGGRPIGAFMAATIRARFGSGRLASVVGNPFAFWRLYRSAAVESGGAAYTLSDAAMRVIEDLEARYAPPRARRADPARTHEAAPSS